jgi:hypothetical protein
VTTLSEKLTANLSYGMDVNDPDLAMAYQTARAQLEGAIPASDASIRGNLADGLRPQDFSNLAATSLAWPEWLTTREGLERIG